MIKTSYLRMVHCMMEGGEEDTGNGVFYGRGAVIKMKSKKPIAKWQEGVDKRGGFVYNLVCWH